MNCKLTFISSLPEFFGQLFDLETELPDELMGDSGTANGSDNSQAPKDNNPNDPAKHQQLSKLLQSDSPTPAQTNNSTASPQHNQAMGQNQTNTNSIAASINSIKSPLSSSLSSPPNVVPSVGNATSGHSMVNNSMSGMNMNTGNNTMYSIANSIGGMPNNMNNISIANSMSNLNTKLVTSSPMMMNSSANMQHLNQMAMNGPSSLNMSGPGRPPMNTNFTTSGNMMGSLGSQLNTSQTQLGHQGMNPPGVPVLKVCSFIHNNFRRCADIVFFRNNDVRSRKYITGLIF